MKRPRTAFLTPALISGFCLLAGSAFGQDALGGGNALDASPSTRGRLNGQRPSFADELQFRNAIATGNAPGGMSFRGDLGYRAAGEFTGALGSDSLFSFRRDSLYSGLAGMGIRGTEAVQYQFALTTGSRPPSDLMGNLAVSRDFGYGSSGSRTNQPIGIDTEQRLQDPSGQALTTIIPEREGGSMLGTLRSSSSYLSTAGMQPTLLSVYGQGVEQTPYGVTASNLRGVTSTPLYSNTMAHSKKGEEEDGEKRPGMQTSIAELANKQVERALEIVKDRKPSSSFSSESGEDWFSDRMTEIRNELYGNTPDTDPTTPAETDDPSGTEEMEIMDPVESAGTMEERANELIEKLGTGGNLEDGDTLDLSPELLAVLRGESKPVNNFINQDISSADVYADHIRIGQQLIAAERYFDAEERFTRALAIRPGDVTAQIGRIHAQMGAGMVLSGAVNLQSVLTEYPQLSATRYSANLLPSPLRTKGLVEVLRERAGVLTDDRMANEDERVRLASGLLLAYLGYQSLDEQAVNDGLSVMFELGSEGDQRLARLLEQIWDVSLAKLEDAPKDDEADTDQ